MQIHILIKAGAMRYWRIFLMRIELLLTIDSEMAIYIIYSPMFDNNL